jgi:hypothetical protein
MAHLAGLSDRCGERGCKAICTWFDLLECAADCESCAHSSAQSPVDHSRRLPSALSTAELTAESWCEVKKRAWAKGSQQVCSGAICRQ